MGDKFRAEVKEMPNLGCLLRVTHNGNQWSSIMIYDEAKEIPCIIAALEKHLDQAPGGE